MKQVVLVLAAAEAFGVLVVAVALLAALVVHPDTPFATDDLTTVAVVVVVVVVAAAVIVATDHAKEAAPDVPQVLVYVLF